MERTTKYRVVLRKLRIDRNLHPHEVALSKSFTIRYSFFMQTYTLEPANYLDYHDFLRERYEEIKKDHPHFSIVACARWRD